MAVDIASTDAQRITEVNNRATALNTAESNAASTPDGLRTKNDLADAQEYLKEEAARLGGSGVFPYTGGRNQPK
jgi:hypothetical protein